MIPDKNKSKIKNKINLRIYVAIEVDRVVSILTSTTGIFLSERSDA